MSASQLILPVETRANTGHICGFCRDVVAELQGMGTSPVEHPPPPNPAASDHMPVSAHGLSDSVSQSTRSRESSMSSARKRTLSMNSEASTVEEQGPAKLQEACLYHLARIVGESAMPMEAMDYMETEDREEMDSLVQRSLGGKLREIFVNAEIAQAIFDHLSESGMLNASIITHAFIPENCSLHRVQMMATGLNHAALRTICSHPLTTLCLPLPSPGFPKFDGAFALQAMVETRVTLRHLCLAGCRHIPTDAFESIQGLSNLVYLDLSGTQVDVRQIHNLPHLQHLNLNAVTINESSHLFGLAHRWTRPQLKTLSLANTWIHTQMWKSIEEFTGLEMLDVTGSDVTVSLMSTVISRALPNLRWLALNGIGIEDEHFQAIANGCPKLQFAGLCLTSMKRPFVRDGLVVAGHNSLQEIRAALEVYPAAADFCFNALRHLFFMYRSQPPETDQGDAMRVLQAMRIHFHNTTVMVAASASMFHLTRQGMDGQDPEVRRAVLELLVEGMQYHAGNLQFQKNACLTLYNFMISGELEYCYEQLAKLLMVAAFKFSDVAIIRISLNLVNSLVCLGGHHKLVIGRSGVIVDVLWLINDRMRTPGLASVLETAWSMLWNITDETPENCHLFFNANGMDSLMACIQSYPSAETMIRNMLGLLGNIAEVPELRLRLLTSPVMPNLREYLESAFDGIEVSYNACGILANLMMLSDDEWRDNGYSKSDVAVDMYKAIRRWPILQHRSINYRSLLPILTLCRSEQLAVATWAHWAIANLCSVYPFKYCEIFLREAGRGDGTIEGAFAEWVDPSSPGNHAMNMAAMSVSDTLAAVQNAREIESSTTSSNGSGSNRRSSQRSTYPFAGPEQLEGNEQSNNMAKKILEEDMGSSMPDETQQDRMKHMARLCLALRKIVAHMCSSYLNGELQWQEDPMPLL
eukprot:Clim_evm16s196 gene=Clim_evmTU16s196